MRATHTHLAADAGNGLAAGVALKEPAFAWGKGGKGNIHGAHQKLLQREHAAVRIVGMAPLGETEHTGQLDQGRATQPHGTVEIPQTRIHQSRPFRQRSATRLRGGTVQDTRWTHGIHDQPAPARREYRNP